jgi:CMP-N,N'-diacetyllegionaminic acid synthase
LKIPNKKTPRVICIIPARGGSKGIKFKNLQKICGKPLLYYPIKAALKSKVCDHIFVSTDSELIAKESKKYGADVPFLRKKKYSGDRVTTESTLKDALKQYENFSKIKFDICVFLTCTNIFRQASWITEAVNILKKNNKIDSAFSVHSFYKHIWHFKGKKLKKVLPWMKNYTSRQIAPDLFREDTGLASATRSIFWRKGKRIGKKVKLIINTDSFTGIDIHNKRDLYMAEMAMKYQIKNKLMDH